MASRLNKIKTIRVAKSDFVITVKMWIRTFNVKKTSNIIMEDSYVVYVYPVS
jgi:hypothetical protein